MRSSETPLNDQLHRVKLDGTDERRITSVDLNHGGFQIAPDGQRLAMQVAQRGRWRVEVLDLSGMLEPDRPGGLRVTTPEETP